MQAILFLPEVNNLRKQDSEEPLATITKNFKVSIKFHQPEHGERQIFYQIFPIFFPDT